MDLKHNSAKYTFYYLLALIALGFVGIGLGQVAFQLINHTFVETTSNYTSDFSLGVLRSAIASLVVGAPIYYFVTRQINKDLAKGEIEHNSAVRRWLTYLILLIASVVTIGFLVAFLNSYLQGELTIKFALKVLASIIIAGSFAAYYIFDLQRVDFKRGKILQFFSAVFVVVVLIAIVTAFILVGSPAKAREAREDNQRIMNLQEINNSIAEFYHRENKLPDDLKSLTLSESTLQDPVSKVSYEFNKINATTYELCANFVHVLQKESDAIENWYFDPAYAHGVGRQCFEVKAYTSTSDAWAEFSVVPKINK
jgi:K+-sensing histidine kinase KdpD